MSIDEKLTESPQIYFELEERITVKSSAFFTAVKAQVLSTSNMWNSNNSRESRQQQKFPHLSTMCPREHIMRDRAVWKLASLIS